MLWTRESHATPSFIAEARTVREDATVRWKGEYSRSSLALRPGVNRRSGARGGGDRRGLCYPRPVTPHSLAEERSLALHRAIAERLRSEPRILEGARERVSMWAEHGGTHREYVDAWQAVLSLSLDEIAALLVDRSEHARALRQASPFAGALAPRERWRIWRAVSP